MEILFDNEFNILSILILFGAFNGFVVTALFLFNKHRREPGSRLFSAIMMIFALNLAEMGLIVYGQIWKFPHFYLTTYPLLFLVGPLYYLYVRRILDPQFHVRWIHLALGLPVALYVGRLWSWYGLDADTKSRLLQRSPIWDLSGISLESYIILGFIFLYTCIFLVAATRRFRQYQQTTEQQFSDNQLHRRLASYRRVTQFIFAYVASFFVLYVLLVTMGEYGAVIDRAWLLVLSVMVHVMGYAAIQQPLYAIVEATAQPSIRRPSEKDQSSLKPGTEKNPITDLAPSTNGGKYQRSALSQEQAEDYMRCFASYLEQTRAYLKSDLRASEVSDQLDIPAYHLSQALSVASEYNFFDFINSYRIEESKRLLHNPDFDHYTVLAIAHDSGFNNKTSFNRAFKKFTGRTPSAFRSAITPPA